MDKLYKVNLTTPLSDIVELLPNDVKIYPSSNTLACGRLADEVRNLTSDLQSAGGDVDSYLNQMCALLRHPNNIIITKNSDLISTDLIDPINPTDSTNPDPTPTSPDPTPTNPDPTPTNPGPTDSTNPDPTPTSPDPTPTNPDPTDSTNPGPTDSTNPDPTPTSPDPTPTNPDPTPTNPSDPTDPTNSDPDSSSTEHIDPETSTSVDSENLEEDYTDSTKLEQSDSPIMWYAFFGLFFLMVVGVAIYILFNHHAKAST